MSDIGPMTPADAFAQLGRVRLSETDFHGVLSRIADLARRSIPGAHDVSVTLVRGSHAHTAAFTGELARDLDESQYAEGRGPCLDAAESGETFSLPDMSTETRWPALAHRAVQAGCHSALAIALPVHDRVAGGLNIYAVKPDAFNGEAILLAEAFAGYAAVALANAHLYDSVATLAEDMQAAMKSRAVIEQAKGIIMGNRRCTSDEAFLRLRKLSQDKNRKLRDIATAVVAEATGSP
jgi:GAF domain-containing protein